jgi:excisionase family DNA binding protein
VAFAVKALGIPHGMPVVCRPATSRGLALRPPLDPVTRWALPEHALSRTAQERSRRIFVETPEQDGEQHRRQNPPASRSGHSPRLRAQKLFHHRHHVRGLSAPPDSEMRHYRVMDTRKSDRRGRWLRVSEWPRVSAWVPPGLALAWLATLASLVHNTGVMLIAWGATVSVVLLAVLVLQRRRAARGRSSSDSAAAEADTDSTGAEAAAADHVAALSARDAVSGAASPLDTAGMPTTGQSEVTRQAVEVTPYPSVVSGLIMPELLVLTAEEVASVLRVDLDLVITSISNGELPGNRIGSHWRIDQRALMRWLQGPYGDSLSRDPSR